MRNQIVQTLDAADLIRLRDSLNRSLRRSSPPELVLINDSSEYVGGFVGGLRYPLSLDGKGGLALSFNSERIKEQVLEIIQTRLGERIYRQYFGLPDLIFESISEVDISDIIKKQLREALPIRAIDFYVSLKLNSEGEVIILIAYELNGVTQPTLKYIFK